MRATSTYTDWYWPDAAAGYRAKDIIVTPRRDPSPQAWYFAHQFRFAGGDGGYMGIQTRTSFEGVAPEGKGAIFSVWSAVDGEGPVFARPFGGEGTGWSVRVPFEWQAGKSYLLWITSEDDGWWAARVGSTFIGRIRVPEHWRGLDGRSVTWLEYYGPPARDCDSLGYAEVEWARATADGREPRHHRNHLGDPPFECRNSRVTDLPDGVLHEMGVPTAQFR